MQTKLATDSPFILVFPHIPKTGGTSLLYHFRKYLGDDYLLSYGPHNRTIRFFQDKYQLEELSLDELYRHRVIMGHGVDQTIFHLLPNADIRLLVVLRHPVSHTRSRFNHQREILQDRGMTITTESFLAKNQENIITNLLLNKFSEFIDSSAKNNLEKSISILQKFDFVFTTEQMNSQVKCLMSQLNLPDNIERRRVAETKEVLQVTDDDILKHNEVDIVLFEKANQILQDASIHNSFGFDLDGKWDAIYRIRDKPLSESKKAKRAYEELSRSLCQQFLAEAALEKLRQDTEVEVAIRDKSCFQNILYARWEKHRKKMNQNQLVISKQKLEAFKSQKNFL